MSFGQLEIRYADGRTTTVELNKRQLVLGRASDLDVTVNDGQVSRRHATLLCGPEGVRIIDAGSANGTYQGATRLPANQPVPLADGAVLRMGATFLRFTAAKDTSAPVPEPEEAPSAPRSAPGPEVATGIRPGAPPARETPPPAFTPPPPGPVEPPAPEEPSPIGSVPGLPASQSNYLKYLPPLYSSDDFLGRFLLIFESILSPLERTVGNLHYYLDAQMAPPEMLPWLASWLGLVLDERWPEAQRRALILAAVDLYNWRGTRRGLSEFLRLYTGLTPEIIEAGAGGRRVTEADAFRFTVRVRVPDPALADRAMIQSIIDAEKPAHAGYTLEIIGG